MPNDPDPRETEANALGQQRYDKSWEGLARAAGRGVQAAGVDSRQFLDQALKSADPVETIATVGVNRLLDEATAGDKDAARQYDDWYVAKFPNSRKAKWIKEGRGR